MQITTNNTSVTLDTGSILGRSYIVPGSLSGSNESNVVFTNGTSNGVISASEVFISGKSLSKILDVIQDRLSILEEPSPEKLEKYTALKKAYEHYKLLEKILNEQ